MGLWPLKIKLPAPLAAWLDKPKVRRLLWLSMIFLCMVIILAPSFLSKDGILKEGQVSHVTITAPMTLTISDEIATEIERKKASAAVEKALEEDPTVIVELERDIISNFRELRKIVEQDVTDDIKSSLLQEKLAISLKSAEAFLKADIDTMKTLESLAISIVKDYYSKGVDEQKLDFIKKSILTRAQLLENKVYHKDIIAGVLSNLEYRANIIYNEVETERLRQEAIKQVAPVLINVIKDQKIIGEGEIVTAQHVSILKALGYQGTDSAYLTMLGLILFVALLITLTGLFLKQYRRDIYRDEKKLILLSLLVTLSLLSIKLVISISINSKPEIAELVGYMVPTAAVSMLIAILLDTKLSIYITTLLSMVIGVLTGNQVVYALVSLIAGIIGVYSVSHLSQRSDLAKAGFWIALGAMITVLTLGLMRGSSLVIIFTGLSMALINGLLSSVLTIGSLPFLESAFGITTSVRLLELSNPNQPLLKRLLLEAPGTYHHSILVGNLAESAADSIGADSLLVRVGAYYHDVGKIKRPYFFIENQFGGENPHEKIAPALSTLIITSHVKDGMELAKEHKLPQVIIDMICQHHAKSLVSFFYHKAKEADNTESVKLEDFRYDATKPQTREAAIVMLADNVEAAVRSMKSPTSGKIEGLVRKIIKDKLHDGQLDESDLTFRDLDMIANSFVRVLNGIFHQRVEYPENVLKQLEGRKTNVISANQPAIKG